MFVGGEGLTDASFLHHHETYAISQTPLLIWAGQKQSQTFGKQVFSHMDDFQSTLLFGSLNLGNELPGEVSQPQSAQTVANFHEDIIGCDHPCTLLLQVSVEGSSLFVISVVSVSQSDPAETVHENFPSLSPFFSPSFLLIGVGAIE
jgi:hypothetical protein